MHIQCICAQSSCYVKRQTCRLLTVSAMPVWRRADQIAASPSHALKGSRLSLTLPENTTGSCTLMTAAKQAFWMLHLGKDLIVYHHTNEQASPASTQQSPAAMCDDVFSLALGPRCLPCIPSMHCLVDFEGTMLPFQQPVRAYFGNSTGHLLTQHMMMLALLQLLR